MKNNILILFLVFFSFISFANDINSTDSKELLGLVSTEKDFADALDLIETSDNFELLKGDKNIDSLISTLSDKFNQEPPDWLNTSSTDRISSEPTAVDKSVDVKDENNSRSLWTIFFLSFAAGFAALLTPCVFPMIPMTVSFFTKQSNQKHRELEMPLFLVFQSL